MTNEFINKKLNPACIYVSRQVGYIYVHVYIMHIIIVIHPAGISCISEINESQLMILLTRKRTEYKK
uniref:Uncharacterized protein n=1 Tax=Octopus bimaculoides TaxID=37653 RepID=A0A0L8FZL7_OCTBM